MKLVCLKRDLDGKTFWADYTDQDRRDGRIPMWQKADGSIGNAATRRDQFYNALRNSAARQALLGVERDFIGSTTQFVEACEAAWQQPGLDAIQTVEAVRKWLEDLR